MTTIVKLSKNESIQSVEQHLLSLQQSTEDMPMLLPTDIPELIGVDVSLLQLLMTWSQKQSTASLRIQGLRQKDADSGLDNVCDNVVGLSAVTLSKRVSSWDKHDIRSKAYAKASQHVDAMIDERAKFQRGTSFAVLCFDGTSKPYPRNLYYANGDVLSARDLKTLFIKRLNLAERNNARRENIEEVATKLGTILFEIFRNTHQWARTTVDGVPIRKGVRGLLIRRYPHQPTSPGPGLEERHKQDAPLAKFLATHIDQTKSGGVLELSVFDGGPGLVRRSRGISDLASLSLLEERAACLACFDKHKTSSGMTHRGIGLYTSLRELDLLDGFLRLRTGRMSLYRNFHDEPFQEGELTTLSDWPVQNGQPIADVAGTVLTFVLPIPEVSGE